MSNFFDRPFSKAIVSITLGALLAGVALYFIFPSSKVTRLNAKDLAMRAVMQDGAGVAADSPFIISSSNAINIDEVKALLAVQPQTEFNFTKKSDKEIEISAKEKLLPNRVYQFSIPTQEQKASWAFQVKGEFHSINTLPTDHATNVPLNTGIEVSFTHENYKEFEKYFSISPRVPGAFEKHKRTMVFVPSKPLAPKTIYKVMVKKGLPLENSNIKLEDDIVFQFETASSDDSKKIEYFELSTDQTEWSTTADQTILFNSGSLQNQNIAITAYKMKDKNTYINSYEKLLSTTYWATFNRYQLQDILTSSAKVKELTVPANYENYRYFANLPERLEKGYYLLALTIPGVENMEPRYMWVQVSNIATYAQLNQNDALFWVNSTETKSAIKGAKVTFSDGASAIADATGVAKLPLPQAFYEASKNTTGTTKSIHAEVSANGETTVLFLDKYQPKKDPATQYYTYSYTDRPVYKPTDTVNFWGIIKPKEGAQKIDNVTAQLTSTNYVYGDYFGYDNPDVILQERQLQVTPLGTFTGSWSIKDMATGCHNIQIKSGDIIYQQTYFCIEQYVKPAYTIDVKTSKDEAMVGEKLKVEVYAHFFEGTPVPFKKITVEANAYDGQNQTFNVTTDKSGHASFTYQPPEEISNFNYTSYWPKNIEIQAHPVSQEEGEIIGQRNITIYGPDAVLTTKQSTSSGNKVLSIELNRLDISKDDKKGAPLSNYPVKGKVIETTYNRVVVGKSYDFISKTTVDKVEYVKNESVTQEVTLTTDAQGKANFSTAFKQGKDVQVQFEIQAPNKRTIRNFEYLYTNIQEEYSFLMANNERGNYALNEQGDVTVMRGNTPAQEDKYLFTLTTEKSLDYTYQTSPVMKFKFIEKMIPAAYVNTVRFTGETYMYAGSANISLDTEKERTLKIDVTSDKKSYEPGENVKLHVRVTKNGNGVAADANISLVDEAYFELYPHNAYPLSSLYAAFGKGEMYYWRMTYTYMTHNITSQGGGGAEGGGGGGDARSVFPDSALFRTITTNGSGDGDITFKLPDNITSWKITTQAVDGQVNAGVEYTTLPVSLPFFTDAVVGTDYLAQDKPLIEIRTFGEKLAANVPVTFTISTSLSDEKKVVTAKSYDTVSFPLPTLKNGKQTITIAAEAAGMKDTLVREFNVIPSRITTYDTKTMKAADMKSIPNEVLAAKGDVTVTIQETEKARMYNELWRQSYATGARFDQVAASEKALAMLKKNFKEEDLPGSDDATSGLGDIYQDASGGVRLLPYASADLELSARAAFFAPETIDQDSLREYFIGILNQEAQKKYPKATRERYIMALSGLASLKNPVLTVIQSLSKETDLSAIEELYLAAGAMSIGDQETSRKLAQDMLKKYGEHLNPYLRLKIGKDNDDILRHTALFTVIAADLNLPELEGLSTYITEQGGKDVIVDLEKVAAIERRVGIIKEGDAEVSYSMNGNKVTKKLASGEFEQVTIPAQMLPNFTIQNTKGDLSVTFMYERGASKDNLKKDANIGITKVFKVNGKATTTWNANDIVVIELTPKFGAQAIDSCYSVTDNLPSGLKPLSWQVSLGDADKNLSRPYFIQGQQTRFCVGKTSKTIRFPARVMNKGTFVSEPAVIQISDRPGSINASDETIVTIQ